MKNHLLNRLKDLTGAEYLSDLHNSGYHRELCRVLSCISPEDYAPAEWTEAVSYILNYHGPVFQSPQSARDFLYDQLHD